MLPLFGNHSQWKNRVSHPLKAKTTQYAEISSLIAAKKWIFQFFNACLPERVFWLLHNVWLFFCCCKLMPYFNNDFQITCCAEKLTMTYVKNNGPNSLRIWFEKHLLQENSFENNKSKC